MQRSTTAILIIALAMASVIGGLFLIDAYLYGESFHSRSSFHVTLSASKTLDNVTLMFPLPSQNGQTEIGYAIMEGKGDGIPDDWRCSLVEVEGGVMLRIEAKRIVPDYRSLPGEIVPIPLESGKEPSESIRIPTVIYSTRYSQETPEMVPIEFGASITKTEPEINTRYPLGNESILSPVRNLTRVEEVHPTPAPTGRASTSSFYRFEVPVYAAYSADPDTTVHITIGATGENSWWVLGWGLNMYTESVELTLIGPDPGWQSGSGLLSAGNGVYR